MAIVFSAGFLLLFADYYVVGRVAFDILPDILGAALMLFAVIHIAKRLPDFKKATPYIWAALGISAVSLALGLMGRYEASYITGILVTAAAAVGVYFYYEALGYALLSEGEPGMAVKCSLQWQIFLTLIILSYAEIFMSALRIPAFIAAAGMSIWLSVFFIKAGTKVFKGGKAL
ncbi:MAG: hypothetical protein ACOYJD_03630 [Christensenellales bacterium]|jgi:hypothetical protein